ncbi:MAG: 4Fe-4S binding protein [bacterium]|nr:4Fe-4S binding protein [bacterium]
MIENKKEKIKRKRLQLITGAMLPVMLVTGVFYPYLGFLVMAMMTGFLILSLFKGRIWCGWLCPRGAFLERYVDKLSFHNSIPLLLKSLWFRVLIIFVFMTSFITQLIISQGDLLKTGMIFIRLCIITTFIALPLAVIYKPRTWCSFCPMGTIQGILGRTRNLLHINNKGCKTCSICAKVCPVATNPSKFIADGTVNSKLCIRCENCVLNCPANVLEIK